jgi:hypothetical protein
MTLDGFRKFLDLLDSDGGNLLVTLVLFFTVAALLAAGMDISEGGTLYAILMVIFRSMNTKVSQNAVVSGVGSSPNQRTDADP